MNQVDIKRLQALKLYFMPGNYKFCSNDYLVIHEKSYDLWKSVKTDGLLSQNLIDKAKNLASDEFLQQDEFIVLVDVDSPVGIFMFTWFDLRYKPNLNHSYFKDNYSKDLLDTLIRRFNKVMVVGNLMIHPKWRKSSIGYGLADVLASLMTKRFAISDAEVSLAVTRNNRKINELGFRNGAIQLAEGLHVYGGDADLVAFFKNSLCPNPIPGIAEVVEYLWEHKINSIILNELINVE